uniref:FUN14 domain-containing protein 1 n=1 Tax=Rhipicephalus appendiculatus TaxID=34631 RepID=A0A131YVZ3_RHIAP
MKPGSRGESWPMSFFKDATKASPAKQLTIGGVSGWCVGFIFTKAGKIAATAIGGSLLLFQVAQHQGYVKVNWSRLNKDLQQAQNELARRTDGKLPRLLEEIGRQRICWKYAPPRSLSRTTSFWLQDSPAASCWVLHPPESKHPQLLNFVDCFGLSAIKMM